MRHLPMWSFVLAMSAGLVAPRLATAQGRGEHDGAAHTPRPARISSPVPDSVTLRVISRSWGGEPELCTGKNWG